jgi:hypothetical protein
MKELLYHLYKRIRERVPVSPLLLLYVRKKLGTEFNASSCDTITIDIVIPSISKDFGVLDKVISSLHFINHTVGTIFVVAPFSSELSDFCKQRHVVLIDETQVSPIPKKDINYIVHNHDRSGWLFQQLLKLNSDTFVNNKYFLVLDSDTVLINPHTFIHDGKSTLYQNNEWHPPYFRAFNKLFGYNISGNLSLTSHMMIFNVDYLREMKRTITQKHNMSWYQVYINTCDKSQMSGISDYDTYGNWLLINYPQMSTTKILYNTSMRYDKLDSVDTLHKKYGRRYNSISFHNYLNK